MDHIDFTRSGQAGKLNHEIEGQRAEASLHCTPMACCWTTTSPMPMPMRGRGRSTSIAKELAMRLLEGSVALTKATRNLSMLLVCQSAGQIRALGTSATKRMAQLPEVPTYDDQGLKGSRAQGPRCQRLVRHLRTEQDACARGAGAGRPHRQGAGQSGLDDGPRSPPAILLQKLADLLQSAAQLRLACCTTYRNPHRI